MLEHLLPDIVVGGECSDKNNFETLSNGDKIEVEWSIYEDNIKAIEQILDINVTYKDFTYTVENLLDVQDVDPFEDIVLMRYGNNGSGGTLSYAWAYVTTGDGETRQLYLAVEEPENNGALSNGDIVHAFIDDEVNEEVLAREYGIRLTRVEADVEMYGLNAYGQVGASNGEKATIDLNDYVISGSVSFPYEGIDNAIQFVIDYEKLLRDYKTIVMITSYEQYLQEPKSLTLEKMNAIHKQMLGEIAGDADAEELYDELLRKATQYAAFRSEWLLWDRETRMERDDSRSSCHNSLIIKFDMLARYLKMQGKATEWRMELGYEKDNPYNRKAIGDFACYLVFINSINAR